MVRWRIIYILHFTTVSGSVVEAPFSFRAAVGGNARRSLYFMLYKVATTTDVHAEIFPRSIDRREILSIVSEYIACGLRFDGDDVLTISALYDDDSTRRARAFD